MRAQLTRREALTAGLATGAGVYGAGLQRALALPRACATSLSDIEHVIFFIQENRSFDHYFGTYKGVRGFSDPRPLKQGDGLPVFAQPGYGVPGYNGHLYPFRLDVNNNGECVHDITHEWGPQHRSWNGGHMDGFVREHLGDEGANGTVTMGHYTRADLPYYHALADAFTICDAYHCSVLGPSDPNHVHIFSGTLDPNGRHGGPLIVNRTTNGQLSWTTMPEQLRASGISWKVYSGDTTNNPITTDSPAPMFAQYLSDSELNSRGLQQTFPGDFQTDVQAGTLPQASWVYAPVQQSDHPPFSVRWGQNVTDSLLGMLLSNPTLWAKTVVFMTWDENGAFFDHVPPLTPPRGTADEYLGGTLPSAAVGIDGPIGLGFRVPLLILSPFTRGGFVCSDRFDHTSLLRFLETRFGAEVPNLSAWRRSVTGDLTSAFNFADAPIHGAPSLPSTSQDTPSVDCVDEIAEKLGIPISAPVYPVPPNQMPTQERGKPRRPSGCVRGRLRVTIMPRGISSGKRVRVRFRVTARVNGRTVSVKGAVIRLAGHRARTGKHGRASITVRFARTGPRLVAVTAPGYAGTSGSLKVHRSKKG